MVTNAISSSYSYYIFLVHWLGCCKSKTDEEYTTIKSEVYITAL